jgi:dynein light intermediate chain, axonemal
MPAPKLALALPPACRELTEDGQLWVQYVSSTPATRLDVITLQERLDQQLQQRQVRQAQGGGFGGTPDGVGNAAGRPRSRRSTLGRPCLEPSQARETGICPVREELYAQCFDELIRQVRSHPHIAINKG